MSAESRSGQLVVDGWLTVLYLVEPESGRVWLAPLGTPPGSPGWIPSESALFGILQIAHTRKRQEA